MQNHEKKWRKLSILLYRKSTSPLHEYVFCIQESQNEAAVLALYPLKG